MDEFEALAASPEFHAKVITLNTVPGRLWIPCQPNK